MTSHELAKKLLEMPDLPVVTYGWAHTSEPAECEDVEEQTGVFSREDMDTNEKHIFIS